ncbi:MAG: hypothetical protein ACT4QF_05280 [Sporichthyaceae bacterium]
MEQSRNADGGPDDFSVVSNLRGGGVAHQSAWRSGAVLAAAGSFTAVGTHVALRASSDGAAPPSTALLGACLVLGAVLWPLASRTTRVRSLAAVLVLAQLATHVAVGLATGRPMSLTPAGLTCCPPGTQTRGGPLGALTAQAGWALFAAQMLACVLLAFAVHGSRRSLDGLAAALTLLREALRPSRVLRLVLALRQIAQPAVPAASVPAAEDRPLPRVLHLVRTLPRRGPPAPRAYRVRPSTA